MSKFFVLLCLGVTSSTFGYTSYRLSSEITPNHYSLKIHPDFDKETFYGEVKIYIKTKTDLENVTLHSSQLNITEVYINQRKAIFSKEPDEKLAIKYENKSLQPGEHCMLIRYSGKLVEKDYGFIKAPYEYYGKKMYIYVTELEPTYARRVFPCFDEPSFKAKFNIRLISPNQTYKAISNMPEIAKFTTNKGVVYDFSTTVKMSTYLVSFAFTEYTYYEEMIEEVGRNVPIRIYTLNANKENNAFATECTKKAIAFYSEYTNISYPLPKLDMIEYNRTKSAATENWGLITFREGLLTTTLRVYSKSQIQLVIYHELGHFWFGNLESVMKIHKRTTTKSDVESAIKVTNEWWNDIWLQEGFATYMSYKLLAIQDKRTQIEEMKSFQVDDFFEMEINYPTSPIVSYLSIDTDISDKFNSVIYDKGAFLLLMLEDVLGEDIFKLAIQTFLKKHAFGTATTNNFISVVEEITPQLNIRSFIESYLYQNKFPMIKVSASENGTYILTQGVCKTVNSDQPNGGRWTIPVTYVTDRNPKAKLVWFDKDMDELHIQENGTKWIIFNPQGKGMYKTIIERSLWNQISEYFQEFDELASETLISDAYYSYRFNMISCDALIDLMLSPNMKSMDKWILFFPFFNHLKENLTCNGYKNETVIFLGFIQRRFDEINFKRNVTSNLSCATDYNREEPRYLDNVKKCAKWIRENLQSTVKP